MLLCLPWIETGDRRGLTAAAALLGLAVLAKGLVPLVLALPVVWAGRRRLRDLLRPAPIAAFLVVTAPWYVAVTMRHGSRFFDEFFLRHHFERFATESLRHVQPFWFYVPVSIAALFPWSPLIALLFRRTLYKDPRARFLLVWVVFGFVFFSAASNKLPGYLLPLLPATAALAGLSLSQLQKPRLLVFCALLLSLVPVVAAILPGALMRGITRAGTSAVWWPAFAPFAALAALVWLFVRRGRRDRAVLAIVAATAAAVVWLEARTYPVLDRAVSARVVWREVAARRRDVCVAGVNRGWRYNLNYYSVTPLPGCDTDPRPVRIEQPEGGAPTWR
jgi:4-amino-4-deoxy-L-arabinose transferase-like glycosyltransferase